MNPALTVDRDERVWSGYGLVLSFLAIGVGLSLYGYSVDSQIWPFVLVTVAYGSVLLSALYEERGEDRALVSLAISILPPVLLAGLLYLVATNMSDVYVGQISSNLLFVGAAVAIGAAYHLGRRRSARLRWALVGLVLAPIPLAHGYRMLVETGMPLDMYIRAQGNVPGIFEITVATVLLTAIAAAPTYRLGRLTRDGSWDVARVEPATVLGGLVVLGVPASVLWFDPNMIPTRTSEMVLPLAFYVVPALVVLSFSRSLRNYVRSSI